MHPFESRPRRSGRDGYVFGDLTRGMAVRVFGKGEADVEAEGDARQTQVQRLVSEAIKLYRARGYSGSINMAHTVAYFNESVSLKVDGPSADAPAPWELPGGDEKAEGDGDETPADVTDDELAEALTHHAITEALGETVNPMHASQAAVAQLGKEGQAGLVFATLLARLQRRAKSWQALKGFEGLDPSLTQSAQIGFALPVIKIGWGVSVSLTVTTSSLLRWAEHEASLAGSASE